MPFLKVALTGGIACGKSIVADYLEKKGCYIHRADEVAHQLMLPGKKVWKMIVAHFGESILNPDGTINRRQLGEIVFGNQQAREFLNHLIHPLVLKKKKQILRRLEKTNKEGIFISEAALTIEAGFISFFDKIIVVWCPEEIQIERLMSRNQLTREEAERRIRAQLPVKEKLKYADYVIDTSGTIEETLAQTEKVFQSLLKDLEVKKLAN
ncbi:MAG: dephospho-CoA kinase [Candidatus Aminicenantes bacterium]|nr:dephospho-CoA kinase [Candidatus Aminicenantes bacterium]